MLKIAILWLSNSRQNSDAVIASDHIRICIGIISNHPVIAYWATSYRKTLPRRSRFKFILFRRFVYIFVVFSAMCCQHVNLPWAWPWAWACLVLSFALHQGQAYAIQPCFSLVFSQVYTYCWSVGAPSLSSMSRRQESGFLYPKNSF